MVQRGILNVILILSCLSHMSPFYLSFTYFFQFYLFLMASCFFQVDFPFFFYPFSSLLSFLCFFMACMSPAINIFVLLSILPFLLVVFFLFCPYFSIYYCFGQFCPYFWLCSFYSIHVCLMCSYF